MCGAQSNGQRAGKHCTRTHQHVDFQDTRMHVNNTRTSTSSCVDSNHVRRLAHSTALILLTRECWAAIRAIGEHADARSAGKRQRGWDPNTQDGTCLLRRCQGRHTLVVHPHTHTHTHTTHVTIPCSAQRITCRAATHRRVWQRRPPRHGDQ